MSKIHTITIDDDAHKRLNRTKAEMTNKGIGKPNYSEAIRHMDVKT